MRIDVVLSSNERYMPGAQVAIAGVCVNAQPETELVFHLFVEDVSEPSIDVVRKVIRRNHPNGSLDVRPICDEQLKGLPEWAGSRMAAARCLYPEILREVDWAMYLDCDVLYLASPEEHWQQRDDNCFAVVSQEQSVDMRAHERAWIEKAAGMSITDEKYFNSGVMLFNFKKMREDGCSKRLLEFFRNHPDVASPDQDALNTVFGGNVKVIDQRYNWLQIYLDDVALVANPVIHYVSGVPWLPKLGVVANRRFRLWHRFADKYVWQKRGMSYRRCFSRSHIVMKYLEYWMLKTPLVSLVFRTLLAITGRISSASGWKHASIDFDVSDGIICKVLDR